MQFSMVNVTALVALVLAVTGLPVKQSKWDVVRKILFEDKHWKELLSERVRLDKENVPLGVRNMMIDYDDIDPLVTLHRLMRPEDLDEHYSASEMTLGMMIVEMAVTCMTLKRTVVYVALALRLAALESENMQLAGQASVFAHIIPYSTNALPPTNKAYEELMSVYEVVMASIVPDDNEQFDKDKYVSGLTAKLESMDAIVAASCKSADIKKYFKQLQLPTALNEQLDDVFADGHQVSENVQQATIIALLRDTENAVMDESKKFSALASQDVAAGQQSLKGYPKTLPECFVRTPPTNYRKVMMEMLREKAKARAKKSPESNPEAHGDEGSSGWNFAIRHGARTVPVSPKFDRNLI